MFQRLIIGALALTTAVLGAEEAKKSKTVTAKAAKLAPAAKPAPALTVPEDAERIAEHTYRKREANGKVYIYRRTPFGVSRVEEGSVQQAMPSQPKSELITAIEDGDTVRFERPGPFGKSVWTRKKSELTAEERSIVEKQKNTAVQK